MAKVLVTESSLEAIGAAIRAKKGGGAQYSPSEMAPAIRSIPTPVLVSKTITENGTYYPSVDSADGYSEVTVNVEGGGVDIPDATGVSF